MEWTIDYLEEDGIVFSKVSGLMDWDQHKKWCKEAFSVARKHNARKMLNDLRDMVPSFTILQIDDLPKVLKEAGAGPEHRIAAVYDPSSPHSSEFVFFRDVAAITSIKVKYFSDKDTAIAWLKSEK
jgi:hypothetical protein